MTRIDCLKATLGRDPLNPSTLTHPWSGWNGFMWGAWRRCSVRIGPVLIAGYWKPTPRRWFPPRSMWRVTWRNLVYELVKRPRWRAAHGG